MNSRSRVERRRFDWADDEFDRRFAISGGRSVPLDNTGRDGLWTQPSLLDQGHDLGKQRSSMRPSDEEADPEGVKPAERHRHVAARIEGHTLQNALRLRGSDGVLQARRCPTRVYYDGIAALRLFEIRLERASAEAFGKCQRFGAVARIIDRAGAKRDSQIAV